SGKRIQKNHATEEAAASSMVLEKSQIEKLRLLLFGAGFAKVKPLYRNQNPIALNSPNSFWRMKIMLHRHFRGLFATLAVAVYLSVLLALNPASSAQVA